MATDWSLKVEPAITSWPVSSRTISPHTIHRASFTVPDFGRYTFSIELNSGSNDGIFWIVEPGTDNSYNTNGNYTPKPDNCKDYGTLPTNTDGDEELIEIDISKIPIYYTGQTYYIYYSHAKGTNNSTSNIKLSYFYWGNEDLYQEELLYGWGVTNRGWVESWPFSILVNPGTIYRYKFVANQSTTYTFESQGSCDTYGWLSTSDSAYKASRLSETYLQNVPTNYIQKNDDDGDLNNFKISTSLTKNQTYYLYFGLHSLDDSSGTITIAKTAGGDTLSDGIITGSQGTGSGSGSSDPSNPSSSEYGQQPTPPSASHPSNAGSPPNEGDWTATYYSNDGKSTSTTNIDMNDSYTASDSTSNAINITLINSLIDCWNSICQKRTYYGNLYSLKNSISKISSQTIATNNSLNTLINTYNRYFTPHSTINIVNQGEQISKNTLSLLKTEFSNKNRTCKQACTGYCTTTNSHSSTRYTCNGHCSGGCSTGCAGCSGNCAGTCIGCTGTCKIVCTSYCQETCSSHCGSGCSGQLEGIYGRPGSGSGGCSGCDTVCTTNCGNNCTGSCVNGCYTGCVDDCGQSCNSFCGNDCMITCGGTCSYGGNAGGNYQGSEWGYDDCGGGTCNTVCGTTCGGHCNDQCEQTCGGSCYNWCAGTCADGCSK